VGMMSLAVILATLTARWHLPRQVPGALAAVVVGCLLYYGMNLMGLGPGLGGGEGTRPESALRAALPMPASEWLEWFKVSWQEALMYLPVAIPLALGTVVGGIDCTESAASAGDDYPTGQIIAAEGVATLVGGLFGGVIQSTPYIGHPAYKAMGARAGYTLTTALFVGAAGIFGFFDWIFYLLPPATVFPILIFVGLEITAQSFHATPPRHFAALAIAFLPTLAYLATLPLDGALAGRAPDEKAAVMVQTLRCLASGFIVTSLLWAAALAALLDGHLRKSAAYLLFAGACALIGVIHSPLTGSPIAWPWDVYLKMKPPVPAILCQSPFHWTGAYVLAAAVLIGLSFFRAEEKAGSPEALDSGERGA
jgi:adenine/guanine/hypoxanthine permease